MAASLPTLPATDRQQRADHCSPPAHLVAGPTKAVTPRSEPLTPSHASHLTFSNSVQPPARPRPLLSLPTSSQPHNWRRLLCIFMMWSLRHTDRSSRSSRIPDYVNCLCWRHDCRHRLIASSNPFRLAGAQSFDRPLITPRHETSLFEVRTAGAEDTVMHFGNLPPCSDKLRPVSSKVCALPRLAWRGGAIANHAESYDE